MNRNYVVYVHINKTNGKRYYGITSMKPERRWRNGHGYQEQYFARAINKYGWDGFDHIIVAHGLTEEEAKWLEIQMIASHDTTNKNKGYNISFGGEGNSGHKHSEDTKQKISEAHKGKTFSEETKQKMSEAKTPEIRKIYSERYKGEGNPMYGRYGELNPFYGKKHTPETIQKIKENRPDTHGKNNPKAHSVICITTKRIFFTLKDAAEYYSANTNTIGSCCRGTGKSAGKLPDGTKLVWRYLNYKHDKTYRIA